MLKNIVFASVFLASVGSVSAEIRGCEGVDIEALSKKVNRSIEVAERRGMKLGDSLNMHINGDDKRVCIYRLHRDLEKEQRSGMVLPFNEKEKELALKLKAAGY